MQWLPPLETGDCVLRLPLRWQTGRAWLQAIMAADAGRVPARLAGEFDCFAEAIRDDPAFALWGACLGGAVGTRLGSAGELAAWLVQSWPEQPGFPELTRMSLKGTAKHGSLAGCDGACAEQHPEGQPGWTNDIWCERIRSSVAVARVARELATTDLAEEAYWLGLLSFPGEPVAGLEYAPTWLRDCLTQVGSDPDPGSAAAAVATAQAIVSSADWSGARAEHLEYAQQVAECWRREAAGDGRGDPVTSTQAPSCASFAGRETTSPLDNVGLVLRLVRLRQLEQRFDERLHLEKLDSLRQFAYGASHEINNPLANISSRAQTLLRDERDPERRRTLATINAQAFRAHEMIADLMLFAKPPKMRLEETDLLRLVDQVIAEIGPAAAEQETIVERRSTGAPVVASVDPQQLAVALRALCVNALDALGTGGRVDVQVESVGGGSRDLDRDGASGAELVRITVTDTGPGVSSEARRHLFDPFYSGREAGRGLGLGLSKTWRIVTEHSGRIQLDTDSTPGARFVIELPARRT